MELKSSERLKEKRSRREFEERDEAASLLETLRKTPIKPKQLSFSTSNVDPYAGMTQLARNIYGNEKVDEWLEQKKPIRKIWELSSPTTQCVKTIGSATIDTKCWLCGLNLFDSIDALKPVCEHILPIAQAVYFLELYSVSKKELEVDISEIVSLEYSWAHTLCNSIKNSSLFIRQSSKKVEGYNLEEVNVSGVNDFLYKLMTTDSTMAGASTIKDVLGHQDYLNRVKKSIIEKVQTVVDFMNEPIKRGEGSLLLLARSASYVDPTNVNPQFSTSGGRKTFRHKINGRSVRRSTAKSNGSTSRSY